MFKISIAFKNSVLGIDTK